MDLYTFFRYLFPNSNLISATDGAARIRMPTTLSHGVIRTYTELHQTATFEGLRTNWATAPWQGTWHVNLRDVTLTDEIIEKMNLSTDGTSVGRDLVRGLGLGSKKRTKKFQVNDLKMNESKLISLLNQKKNCRLSLLWSLKRFRDKTAECDHLNKPGLQSPSPKNKFKALARSNRSSGSWNVCSTSWAHSRVN